jgi:hypothetical protein
MTGPEAAGLASARFRTIQVLRKDTAGSPHGKLIMR